MEGISYFTVCNHVAWRRPESRVQVGRSPPEVPIDQEHRPGVDAEVDFGDVVVNLAGKTTVCHLFAFRLSYSGKAVHHISLSCSMHTPCRDPGMVVPESTDGLSAYCLERMATYRNLS